MLDTVFLPPNNANLALANYSQSNDGILLDLKMNAQSAHCPKCSQLCNRVHSSYSRKLKDLSCVGHSLMINISSKKFFCDNEGCRRKIFTTRLGEEMPTYSRRTNRFTNSIASIGFVGGGNKGARLSTKLGIPVSASTVLRIVKGAIISDVESPRVLGVDDWAFKKGHTYGTILVDLEKQKPIDLLPDRESGTLAEWLKKHPDIEIVSRDRASAYASGIELGAPQAIQVADRWHLLKNLGDALKRMLDSYNKELNLAAKEVAHTKHEKNNEESAQTENIQKESPEKALSRYELNFLEVKRLSAEGHSNRAIHRQTGVNRQTIARYLKYEEYPEPEPAPPRKGNEVWKYEEYIRGRWEEGQQSGKRLWEEIKEMGFKGSLPSVYRFIAKYPRDPKAKLPKPVKVKAWSPRKVGILLGKEIGSLHEAEQAYLSAFYKHCPIAKLGNELALEFKNMMDARKGDSLLDSWLEKAVNSGIAALNGFAKGIKADYDAVKAGLTLEWSNGQVEGQVNRLKTLKREMYGRAGFELLKKRVLFRSG